jgi:precorrin-6A synthase
MRHVLLIGIGPGDPSQVTYQAVEALGRATVFFLLDKGMDKDELVRLRTSILERYVSKPRYRLVRVRDPRRNTGDLDYTGAVQQWHRQRAALYARLLQDELGPADVGAFLLWGEPGLYDSTLRVLDLVRQGGMDLSLEVIPGISSVQALAARHQVALNRIGEPLTIVPGRRLMDLARVDNVVVMLDGQCAFAHLEDPDLLIYWGAYLGTVDEILIAGPLHAVRQEILEQREKARARKGWIMDTYLLRRPS